MNLGKLQKNIYRKYCGKVYKIVILSGGEPKKKKCLFPIYIRRKSIYRKIHKFWAKPKKKKGCYSIYIYRKHITERVIFPIYRQNTQFG